MKVYAARAKGKKDLNFHDESKESRLDGRHRMKPEFMNS
jgi:hypothetical protein